MCGEDTRINVGSGDSEGRMANESRATLPRKDFRPSKHSVLMF